MTTRAILMKLAEWMTITLGVALLSYCFIILIAAWLVLDVLLEMVGSLSMNLEEFGLRRVLESVAIAVSTLSMISYGSYWTPTGFLLGIFWIVLAIQEFKMHQRVKQENRELRIFASNYNDSTIGDPSCRYNAQSSHLRCSVNPIGPCTGCIDYREIE